ncbi:MAG: hypothetical protein ACXVFQ_00545 [Solirubrobacteraceae bacterium]
MAEQPWRLALEDARSDVPRRPDAVAERADAELFAVRTAPPAGCAPSGSGGFPSVSRRAPSST